MTSATRSRPRRVLILWNQVEDDIYEQWQTQPPAPLPWDPSRFAADVRSVQDELDDMVTSVRASGHQVWCLNIRDDVSAMLAALHSHQPDVVFNLVEYLLDDAALEASVVGLYEALGYPYTGSNGYTLSLCQQKPHTKLLLEGAGLPTPPHFVIASLDDPMPDAEILAGRFPFIVKPAREDASGGIEHDAVVSDYAALLGRIQHVLSEFEQPALVEQYIEGREIHVAILGNQPPEVLPLFEMLFTDAEAVDDGRWHPRIISYSGKWDPRSRDFYNLQPVCPAPDIDPVTAEVLGTLALNAFRATGCRDYARIDMRLASDGTPYILEVNPNPDLTDGSAFIMCARASGRSYAQTLHELVEMAAARGPAGADDGTMADARPTPPTDLLHRKYWQPPDEP